MYPNLSGMELIALDFETKDYKLGELGTDAIRRRSPDSRILGVAIAVEDASWYFHWDQPHVEDFTRDVCATRGKLIGANLKYDLLWAFSYGLWGSQLAKKRYGDIIVNGALIDSEADPRTELNLDGQGRKYGFPLKKIDALLEAGKALGLRTKDQVMSNLDLLPPQLLAEYGEYDARLTYDVYVRQERDIQAWKLERVQELEERLLPIMALMETRGVPVNEEAVHVIRQELNTRLDEIRLELNREAGFEFGLSRSNKTKDYIKQRLGLTGDSIAKPVLEPYAAKDPFIRTYLEAKGLDKFLGTYINGTFKEHTYNGMIYPSWRQTAGAKGEDVGGARTGRPTCTNPSLVNIPVRHPVWGKRIRALIKAADGHECLAADFSQAEPRWIVDRLHNLRIPGVDKAVQQFQNPDEDWHTIVANMSKVPRTIGKTLFLGRAYMGGIAKLHAQCPVGTPFEQIEEGIRLMDQAFPFLRIGGEAYMRSTERKGFCRTVLGRIRRFPLWEPARYGHGEIPLPEATARAKWFHKGTAIKRAKTYMAMNSVIQGSSADEMKQSIVNLFYTHDIFPSVVVYDEAVDCYVEDADEWRRAYKTTMESAIPKVVPTRVDIEVAGQWTKP